MAGDALRRVPVHYFRRKGNAKHFQDPFRRHGRGRFASRADSLLYQEGIHMDFNWKDDPRLKGMDTKKLEYLNEFADKVRQAPKDRLMATFLSLNMEASQKGIQFTDQETELLVSILTANMSPAEKKRLDTLKMLSKRLGGGLGKRNGKHAGK